MLDLIREIGQTLRHNKLRTALTGFAVAWGIFMLVVLLSLAQGIINSAEDGSNPDNTNLIRVYNGRTAKPYKGYKDGRRINMKESDLKYVEDETAQYTLRAMGDCYIDSVTLVGPKGTASGIDGINAPFFKSLDATMLAGRALTESDERENRRTLLIPKRTAIKLFGEQDDYNAIVGKYVAGGGLAWQVVGVYDHDWMSDAFVPLTTAMNLGGNDGHIYTMRVRLRDDINLDQAEAAEQELRNTLAQRHEFDPTDESAVWISNQFANYQEMKGVMNILRVMLWTLGLLTMLSGIVGVSNIMFVSVRERAHEIGIRRAIGAKPRNILWQVVAESIAITSLFGYIGMVFGMLVMGGVQMAFGDLEWLKDPQIDISIAIEVLVVLVIAGTLAGLFPALKATKVKPIEALREE